ncbi:MAG: hypothetical protein PHS14_20635 [Elusimicrobia bacterium]|nr:hypothetical protein [Elusimicrobiota bacterium]
MSEAEWWAFLNSQFLGTFFLFATLVAIGVYAYDTRRIATAAARQIETAREQRDREDRRALGAIAVFLLEYSVVAKLYKETLEQERARWRIRSQIANTAFSVEGKGYLPICAEISHFVNHGYLENASASAVDLAGKAAALSNQGLMEEYYRQVV